MNQQTTSVDITPYILSKKLLFIALSYTVFCSLCFKHVRGTPIPMRPQKP